MKPSGASYPKSDIQGGQSQKNSAFVCQFRMARTIILKPSVQVWMKIREYAAEPVRAGFQCLMRDGCIGVAVGKCAVFYQPHTTLDGACKRRRASLHPLPSFSKGHSGHTAFTGCFSGAPDQSANSAKMSPIPPLSWSIGVAFRGAHMPPVTRCRPIHATCSRVHWNPSWSIPITI